MTINGISSNVWKVGNLTGYENDLLCVGNSNDESIGNEQLLLIEASSKHMGVSFGT